jgi:hypothetical protein
MSVGHIRVLPVVDQQHGNRHAAREGRNVERVPADLQPMLQVLSHHGSRAGRNPEMLRERMREDEDIGWRRQENHAPGRQSAVHGQ